MFQQLCDRLGQLSERCNSALRKRNTRPYSVNARDLLLPHGHATRARIPLAAGDGVEALLETGEPDTVATRHSCNREPAGEPLRRTGPSRPGGGADSPSRHRHRSTHRQPLHSRSHPRRTHTRRDLAANSSTRQTRTATALGGGRHGRDDAGGSLFLGTGRICCEMVQASYQCLRCGAETVSTPAVRHHRAARGWRQQRLQGRQQSNRRSMSPRRSPRRARTYPASNSGGGSGRRRREPSLPPHNAKEQPRVQEWRQRATYQPVNSVNARDSLLPHGHGHPSCASRYAP